MLDNAAPLWFATYDNVQVVLYSTSDAINDDNLYASRSHSLLHSEGKSQAKSLFTGTNDVFLHNSVRWTTAVGKQYTDKSASGKFDLDVFAY